MTFLLNDAYLKVGDEIEYSVPGQPTKTGVVIGLRQNHGVDVNCNGTLLELPWIATVNVKSRGNPIPNFKPIVKPVKELSWKPNQQVINSNPYNQSKPEAPIFNQMVEAFQFVSDRIDWNMVAQIHIDREWSADKRVGLVARDLKLLAHETFTAALADKRYVACNTEARILVTVDWNNKDRPVEIYSEAFNGNAYRAKYEELWPTLPPAIEKPLGSCRKCNSPFWSGGAKNCGVGLCSECHSIIYKPNQILMTGRKVGKSKTNFDWVTLTLDGLEPKPSVEDEETYYNLTKAQLYHLKDDTGWLTPSWEA